MGKVSNVTIDLDKPIETRYNVLKEKYNLDKLINDIRCYMVDMIGFKCIILNTNNNVFLNFIKLYIYTIINIFGYFSFYYNEYKIIAKIFNIHISEIILANLIYEFSIFCTSFICKDSNNQLMHGRSLDWPCEFLREYTTNFIYKKNNKIIYKTVGWPGMVGVLTCVKKEKFSISINARYPTINKNIMNTYLLKKILDVFIDNEEDKYNYMYMYIAFKYRLYCLLSKHWTCGNLVKYVLENCSNYNEAKMYLEKEKVLCPVYFILTGIENGCIINKDYFSYKTEILKNYIVQTNHDRKEKTDDLSSLERFRNANKYIKKLKNILNIEDVLNLLSKSTSKGGVKTDITLYISVMIPCLKNNLYSYKI